MNLSFAELRSANVQRHHEVADDLLDPKTVAKNFIHEISKRCTLLKDIHNGTATNERIGSELAEYVIGVDFLCLMFGINLSDAVIKQFNKTSINHNLLTRLKEV